jgi:hypothetical protein
MAWEVFLVFVPLLENTRRGVVIRSLQRIAHAGCDSGGAEVIVYPHSNAVAHSSGGDNSAGDDILQGSNSRRVVQCGNDCREDDARRWEREKECYLA